MKGSILTTFRDLNVAPEICDALERVAIIEPFPIQEMTLPVALAGTDLIGQARTGTGKTLGFGVPLLQRSISPDDPAYADLPQGKPQALVVCPTRELALQVAGDLRTASTIRTMRVLTVYGGVGYEPQLDALAAGVDIVVGTPGRLLDLADRGALDLGHVHALVLDEADEMLDLGFLPDVERILSFTPTSRQTMLFSATMPSAVVTLARRHMRSPLNIRAEHRGDSETVPTTKQHVYRAHDLDKPEVVARVLQAEGRGRTMIFCRTKRAADRLTDNLRERGFNAQAIHGDLNQAARERALQNFRGEKTDILIATDVAARGIDVEAVTHVINYECPDDEKNYVHRIGRTGRAGATGTAITFVDWADLARWKMINATLGLDFAEPTEIYSTSPELYADLDIPTDANGKLPGSSPQPRNDSSQRLERANRGRRDGSNRDRGRSGGRERAPGGRNRGSSHGDASGGDATHKDHGQRRNRRRPSESDTAGANNGEERRGRQSARNRSRRRTRSGKPVTEGDSN